MTKSTDQKSPSPPVKNHKPSETLWKILGVLVGWYTVTWPEESKPKEGIAIFFLEKVFGMLAVLMKNENLSGKQVEEFTLEELKVQNKNILDRPEEATSLGIHSFVIISCGYCIEAAKAENGGDINLAWTYIAEASFWAGVVNGTEVTGNALVQNARKAANIRHAPHRKTANAIKKWFVDNEYKFSSLDSASERAIKEFPVSFRTARKHIGDIAKELRSARKE